MALDFNDIRAYLLQFNSGEIKLCRDFYPMNLAVIYLNNPEKKNAITGKMMVDLRDCILEVERWPQGKALLICGMNGNFCSGGDLEFAKASGTRKEALFMCEWMQDTLTHLKRLPMVTFCLIQGPTLGGGAEISTACDYIIATDDVRYGFVHGKMGIITAWGGGTRLVHKLGPKRAMDLLLTAKLLNAQECYNYGIADCIVESKNCFADSLEFIKKKMCHDYTIVRMFKQVCLTAASNGYKESLRVEKKLFSDTWGSPLNRDALAKNLKHVKIEPDTVPDTDP